MKMGNQRELAFLAEKIIDPVCGMQVHEGEAHYQVEHKDNAYYFCTPKCRIAFARDPEKYVRLLRFASNEW